MPTPPDFELWSKYEDIAMHFNGLLIQFRIQVLGGLTALITVGGYLVGEKVTDRQHRFGVLSLYSLIFMSAWAGAAALDLFYYRRLLQGAVDAILELEASGPIKFSKTIENHMGYGNVAPLVFYGVVLAALACVFAWSMVTYRALRIEARATPPRSDPE